MNRLKTDVLLIGGGAAGIRAAVEAAAFDLDVTLVSNAPIAATGSTFSKISRGWGIQALMNGERTPHRMELFYDEILAVGQGTANPELARILVEESGDRVKELIDYGVLFKKTEDGLFYRASGCFSTSERAVITSDFDNLRTIFKKLLRQQNINVVEATVIDLVVRDGHCHGAFVWNTQNEVLQISAKATILATGGGGALYENHLCGKESTGDGYAIATRAGAQICNMEFTQFMLGLKFEHNRQFLPRHLLYQENIIIDADGNSVLERRIPNPVYKKRAVQLREKHCPASTCDISFMIDMAVWDATQKAGSIYWNANKQASIKPEVVHMAHAFNGGIKVNAMSASTLTGLFAAGEVAGGPHGADRIGGCMMTATQVFGKRAGYFAAKYAKNKKNTWIAPLDLQIPVLKHDGKYDLERKRLDELEQTVKQSMNKYVSVVRTQSGLESCQRILFDARYRLNSAQGATRRNYIRYNKVRNMIDVAELMVQSALKRETSCGPHFRADTKNISKIIPAEYNPQ